MTLVHFVTHPEVVIDPAVPVPDWRLSTRGVERMRAALACRWVAGVTAVASSTERKAVEAAAVLAGHRGVAAPALPELGENDRSATGYLVRDEFEAVADAFFARPGDSVRGWERAVDAQRRIVAAVERAVAGVPAGGTLAVVSHGGVGALLLCHLRGVAISRAADQPGGGGGNRFSFDAATGSVVSGWRAMEEDEDA